MSFTIPTAADLYGTRTAPAFVPSAASAPEFARQGRTINPGPPWHPSSPLFWMGALIALTFGLIGVATEVHVGPLRAAGKVGS